MATRDRLLRRANRTANDLVRVCGAEIRLSRVTAGLSQRDVGDAAELSHATVSRIERGISREVSVLSLAKLATVVGLDLSVRLYPGGDPIRDAAQFGLLSRLRGRIHPDLRWRTEVPLPLPGDRRAWDAVIAGPGFVVGVEAETRLRDIQAVARRTNLKQRDGGLDRVLLLVADTRANRHALRQASDVLSTGFPVAQRDALRALNAGRAPAGNALIVL